MRLSIFHLFFVPVFERVALDLDDTMHRMGNIVYLFEPGPLPMLESTMLVGFLIHVLCRVPQIAAIWAGATVRQSFINSPDFQENNMMAARHATSF